MPGIILALLAHRAADARACRDGLPEWRRIRHVRAPIEAIAEQQFLSGFGFFQRIPEGDDVVESLIDRPRAGEKSRVGLARIDDALKLGVRQHAVSDEVRR